MMEDIKNTNEINEDQLSAISGGAAEQHTTEKYMMDMACPFCGHNSVYKNGRIYFCHDCGKEIPMY